MVSIDTLIRGDFMRGESRTLNFICSLVPGVGFMYNGLYKKGISFIILWFLIVKFDNFLGLSLFSPIILIPIWFYCFQAEPCVRQYRFCRCKAECR